MRIVEALKSLRRREGADPVSEAMIKEVGVPKMS